MVAPDSATSHSGGLRGASELPALVSHVRQGRCILFVGAGLSRAAGHPDWKGLMQAVVKGTLAQLKRQHRPQAAAQGMGTALFAPPQDASAELRLLLKRGRYTECADQCRVLLGRAAFAALLRGLLPRSVEPPPTHRAIVATPYAGIVTTNFDTLLEEAYALYSSVGVPRAPTGAELAQHGTLLLDRAFFILKAHGSIDDAESLVFTSEDYRRITHENPAFQALMSALLLSHAVLFVGYSLNDPNFRLLLDSQLSTFGGQMPPRYALMEDVGPVERQVLRRTAGIEVISFAKGDFAQVGALLLHLARESAPLPPRTQLPPAPTGPLSHAAVAAALAPLQGSAARKVLRHRAVDQVVLLQLRSQGTHLLLHWFVTTSNDLQGLAVPLQQQYGAVSGPLDWRIVREWMHPALDAHPDQARLAQRHIGASLGQALQPLWPWLAKQLQQPGPRAQAVVLDIAPELAALPWEWALCGTDAGAPALAHLWPVWRTVTEPREAARGRPLVGQPLRVLLVADTLSEPHVDNVGQPRPAMRLPGARAEALQLQALLRSKGHQATVLLGHEATYCRVRDEVADGGHDVVHFAGHGWFEDRASMLYLHDGRVSTSEWVTLLMRRPPALWIVSSHYTGWVPAFSVAHPVEFPLTGAADDFHRSMHSSRPGLERASARAGVAAFVGCMGSPDDASATTLELALYRALLGGHSVAQALWKARRSLPTDDATVLQFSVAGHGDLRLAGPKRAKKTINPIN